MFRNSKNRLKTNLCAILWIDTIPVGIQLSYYLKWLCNNDIIEVKELDDEVVWHVRQENIHAAMETEVHCLKKDMLLINYEAPDGSRHHNRLWNGGNGWGTVKLYDRKDGQFILTDEIEAYHIGCEYGEYDHSEAY